MNEIFNKSLLAGDKFIPEMHLKQLGFTYSACGSFTKNKERIQKFKEIGDTKYIYRNELDKACFQHDIAYGDFKYSARITASDKVLRVKELNIAKEIFVIKKVKNIVPWSYVINDLSGEEIIGTFYEKKLQKSNQ